MAVAVATDLLEDGCLLGLDDTLPEVGQLHLGLSPLAVSMGPSSCYLLRDRTHLGLQTAPLDLKCNNVHHPQPSEFTLEPLHVGVRPVKCPTLAEHRRLRPLAYA